MAPTEVRRRSGISVLVVVATLLLSAGLSGCSGDSPTASTSSTSASSTSSTTPSTSSGSASSSTSGSSTSTAAANGASEAGVEGTEKPVATVTRTYRSPYSSGTMSVAVLPLKRRGKLLVLTVVLTPKAEPGGREKISLFDLLGQELYQPELVDNVNLKLYSLVQTPKGTLRADDVGTVTSTGSPLYAWAVFAAPPGSVSSLDVQLSGLGRFSNVPIQ